MYFCSGLFYECFTIMATTFKALVLPHHIKQDGTYNVKIRVTHNRKVRYLPTPFFVDQNQVTKSMKIKNRKVLDAVDEEVRMLRDKRYALGMSADNLDIDEIILLLTKEDSNESCFTDFAQSKINQMLLSPTREKTAKLYQTAINALLKYTNGEKVYFDQMTKSWIINYYNYLLKKVSVHSANSYINVLNTLYSTARRELNDEEAGIIVVKYHCFDLLVKEKGEETKPRAFETVEEMQALIDTEYSGIWIYDFSKDMFIFSFCCLGTNPADFIRLKKSDYQNGIITYRRRKIERRARGKSEIQIRVPEPARIIIEKYSGDSEYLIDFGKHTRRTEVFRNIHYMFQKAGIEPINKQEINGVHKNKYVFNSARHSMATFARNVCGIDKIVVHEMLNHVGGREYAITDVYLRRDYSHLWAANDKLMALFDWSFYLKQKKDLD